MELRKASVTEFTKKINVFLSELHKKHTEGKMDSMQTMLDKIKCFHDDFIKCYGRIDDDLLLSYISNTRRKGKESYSVGNKIATSLYDKFDEVIKGKSITIEKSINNIIDYYRAIRIMNDLYNLGIDNDNITSLNLFMYGTHYINDISIKIYKDELKLKITKLSNPRYTIKKRKIKES